MTKISDMTAAAALDGTELVEVVQGGVNVRATAQAVADLATGASGGGGTGAAVSSVTYTGGNVPFSATTWTGVATATTDRTFAAAEGDILEIGISVRCDSGSPNITFDAGTLVSGSIVNRISGGSNGVQGWHLRGGNWFACAGSIMYQVAAGDIVSGNVTVRLLAQLESAGSRSILGSSSDPLQFWVKNHGAVGTGDADWTFVGDASAPVFQNGWVNYDGATHPPARFRKDDLGYVVLSGLVKSGPLNATMFTLPAGYRPLLPLHFATNATGAFGSLRVHETGNVDLNAGTTSYVSLEARFLAEQ